MKCVRVWFLPCTTAKKSPSMQNATGVETFESPLEFQLANVFLFSQIVHINACTVHQQTSDESLQRLAVLRPFHRQGWAHALPEKACLLDEAQPASFGWSCLDQHTDSRGAIICFERIPTHASQQWHFLDFLISAKASPSSAAMQLFASDRPPKYRFSKEARSNEESLQPLTLFRLFTEIETTSSAEADQADQGHS